MQRLPVDFRHPFCRWCEAHGLDDKTVSKRLAKLGVQCGPRYVRFIRNGNRYVNRAQLAIALSKLTGGEISVEKIVSWRRPDFSGHGSPSARGALRSISSTKTERL